MSTSFSECDAVASNGHVSDVPSGTSSVLPPVIARSHKNKLPIVIIDTQLLSRECLARAISADCGLEVVCFSTIDDWLAQRPAVAASLVVLCQSRRGPAEALKEIERLTELAPQAGHCPAVVLSDNEDPDLIVRMLGKNVRGYVPTSLPIAIAIQAIELARAGGVYVPASS